MKQANIITLLFLLLSLLFGISLMGCGGGYRGNGKIIVERRDVTDFNKIEINQEADFSGWSFGKDRASHFLVKLIKDSIEYTSIEYDENLMHHIETESVNNRLIIHVKKPLRSNRDIHVNVHYKNLSAVDATSLTEVIFGTPYQGKNLQLNITGACDLKGKIMADVLSMSVSGAADINLEGKVRKMKAEFSGAGTLKSFDLLTDTCELDISGAAEAEVNAAKYLRVDASGAADVIYKGSPFIEKSISGAGEVTRPKKE